MLGKFAENTKLGEADDYLEGRKTMQRDLDKLQSWTITGFIKFNKSRWWILHQWCGKNLYILGHKRLERAPWEGTWGFMLTVGRIWISSVSWQPKRPALWGTSGSALPACQGRDCPTLLCVGAASPQALSAVLGTTIKEGHASVREHPREGSKDGEGSRGQDVWGVAELPWCVQLRAEEAEGRPGGSPQLLTWGVEGQCDVCSGDSDRAQRNSVELHRGGSCWVLGKGSSPYGVQALEWVPLWAKYNFFFTFKIIIEHVQGSTSAFLPSFQIVFSVLALLHLRWILKCNFKQDNISNSLITFLLTLFMIDFWYEEEYLSQARWTMT